MTQTTNYDWMVHLDRQVISPLELLHVSGFQPYQLTQRFVVGDNTIPGNVFNHYVPWFDPTRRLYRIFEFLRCKERFSTTPPFQFTDRIPGKININCVWDPETFLALCDPQTANTFTANQLYLPLTPVNAGDPVDDPINPKTVFWRMMKLRSASTDLSKSFGFTGADRPFLPLSTGLTTVTYEGANTAVKKGATAQAVTPIAMNGYSGGTAWSIQPGTALLVDFDPSNPAAKPETVLVTSVTNTTFSAIFSQDHAAGFSITMIGIDDTLLRPVPGGPNSFWGAAPQRLFQVSNGVHPYQQAELMTKIYNNLTVRSNVFAVFLTVGFFEVTDPTTSPPTLGAEIGRSEGRHIRHRMFAIVDRTNLPNNNSGPKWPQRWDPRVDTADPRDNSKLVPYYSIIE
jgi:hypothetical protein